MKVFLKRRLNVFSKLRCRLSSVKWTLLLVATAMFFLSAAAPNGCNFTISLGGGGTSVTGPNPQASQTSTTTAPPSGSPSVGAGSPSVGAGSPSVGAGSPSVGAGSPSVGAGSPPSSPVVAPPTQPAAGPTKPSVAPPSTGGAVHMVSIALGKPTATDSSGFMFVDSVSKTNVTTIKKGTMVTWTNPTKAPHTVTADDGSFDSGTFDPGKTFSMTFATAGTFKYSCDVHPGQVGTVIVQ